MSIEIPAQRVRSDHSWRTALQWISAVAAVQIALHAFISAEPVLTLVAGGVWLAAGVFWTGRGGTGGPVLIAVLATFEIIATLFFTEEFTAGESVAGWILAVHLVMMVAALGASVLTLRAYRLRR